MKNLIKSCKWQSSTVHAPTQWYNSCLKVLLEFKILLVHISKISNASNLIKMVWDSCISRQKRAAVEKCTLIKKSMMQCLNTKNQSKQKMMMWCSSLAMVLIKLWIKVDGCNDSLNVTIWMCRVMTSAQVKPQDILRNARISCKPVNSSAIVLSWLQKSIWSQIRKQCLLSSRPTWSSRLMKEN